MRNHRSYTVAPEKALRAFSLFDALKVRNKEL